MKKVEHQVTCSLRMHDDSGEVVQFPAVASLDEHQTHVVILQLASPVDGVLATVAIRRGDFARLVATPNGGIEVDAALITENK